MGKVFLTVVGGYDLLAGRSKSSPAASIKGQPWREWPEATRVGAACVPFFKESGKDWNLECHFEARTCTACRFKTVVDLSSSPRLSLPPGLAHTQDSCSCFLEEA